MPNAFPEDGDHDEMVGAVDIGMSNPFRGYGRR